MFLLHYMTMHIEQVFYFNFTFFHFTKSTNIYTMQTCNNFFLDPVTSHMTFINTPISYRKLKINSKEMQSP